MSPPDVLCDTIEDAMNKEGRPSIADFFQGRHILVTGATGFMGKVLIEKLLRSCSGLDTLYLLMRPKKGQQPEQRLQEIVQSKLFTRVRGERGEANLLRQLRVVEGDMMRTGLGLNPSVRAELVRKVSVVFHAAATVRFDEPLRTAVLLNTRGTREMLTLAKDMTQLKALVHVSTLFSNCQHEHLLEEVYPTNVDAERLVHCAEWMDETWMNAFTPMMMEGRPNTYVYTKSLAEKMVYDASKTLPVAIFRPSIVMSTLSEPEPDWVDNLNGPSVVVLSGGNGLLRKLQCHEEKVAHVVPADFAINAMISLAWYLANCRPSQCEVFNFTPPQEHSLTWGMFRDATNRFYKDMPFSAAMGNPSISYSRSKLVIFFAYTYMMMWAYLADLVQALTGHKKRFARMQGRINLAAERLVYFTTNHWTCDTNNVLRLLKSLAPTDASTFNFDLSQINWDKYTYQYGTGIRKNIMKEDPSTVPSAKLRIRRMIWMSRGISVVALIGVYHVISTIVSYVPFSIITPFS